MPARRRFVPPRDPQAEPVCLLTREWAARRREPVDALLQAASEVLARADGIEYRFRQAAGIGARIDTFIEEEGECCPFLAFETFEEMDTMVLRVIQPGSEAE